MKKIIQLNVVKTKFVNINVNLVDSADILGVEMHHLVSQKFWQRKISDTVLFIADLKLLIYGSHCFSLKDFLRLPMSFCNCP